MASDQKPKYKSPDLVITWLEAASEMEREKYEKCPVTSDLLSGYVEARGWGYAVAGYSLTEISFKALLIVRGKHVPQIHSLSILYGKLDTVDQEMLQEYYSDYLASKEGIDFPFKTLDEFLKNLDGDLNKRENDYIGSFDWRYYLIEEKRSKKMPIVAIDIMYEIIYGCIRILEYVHVGLYEPSKYTYSWRLKW